MGQKHSESQCMQSAAPGDLKPSVTLSSLFESLIADVCTCLPYASQQGSGHHMVCTKLPVLAPLTYAHAGATVAKLSLSSTPCPPIPISKPVEVLRLHAVQVGGYRLSARST